MSKLKNPKELVDASAPLQGIKSMYHDKISIFIRAPSIVIIITIYYYYYLSLFIIYYYYLLLANLERPLEEFVDSVNWIHYFEVLNYSSYRLKAM